jgi:hypothetical protein
VKAGFMKDYLQYLRPDTMILKTGKIPAPGINNLLRILFFVNPGSLFSIL